MDKRVFILDAEMIVMLYDWKLPTSLSLVETFSSPETKKTPTSSTPTCCDIEWEGIERKKNCKINKDLNFRNEHISLSHIHPHPSPFFGGSAP